VKRLGLIGVGAWGQRYLETAGRRGDCQIAATARRNVLADANQAVPSGDWHELIARAQTGELDGIIAATSPEHQVEVAIAAIRANVPILVEKPLGLSREGPERVLAALDAAREPRVLLINHIHLWAPAYRAVKAAVAEALAEGDVITTVESEGCSRGPFRAWSSLYDYGPHDLSMALDLLGARHSVSLEHAHRMVPADSNGELFSVHLRIGAVKVKMLVGNGAATKRRLFSVGFASGRSLVYDDLLPGSDKATQNGEAIGTSTEPPLSAVLTEFLDLIGSRCRSFERAVDAARLSLRISEVLDDVSASAS